MILNSHAIAPHRLEQIQYFLDQTPFREAQLHPLPGDASFRRYIRVRKEGKTAMIMDAPPEKETTKPYIAVAEYLHRNGYSAPEILARDIQKGLLLLEDLGDDSFTALLKSASQPGLEQELYGCAIDVLVEWHDSKSPFSSQDALALPKYNNALLMQEVGLFSDWYLPQVLGADKALDLREEYMNIWQKILAEAALSTATWVHRDYHADNLMWLSQRQATKRIGLLDFQDGVYGDRAYDLVSLLKDARRDIPELIADLMLKRYINASGVDKASFLRAYAVLGAQRNSKIIGIFARLAARDNKFSYLHFLPRVWRHLEHDLAHPSLIELKQWIDRNIYADQRGVIAIKPAAEGLALTA